MYNLITQNMLKNLFTSLHGWAGILAGALYLDGLVAPLLPSVWQNLIASIFALIAFYQGGKAVTAARAQGILL